jgi:N-acetylneuraminic acid mutarotase
MTNARIAHVAALLPNGKVLAAGGFDQANILASAEIYDPASGTWQPTGSLNVARDYATATVLPNGNVLVAGGCCTATAELYNPGSSTWTLTGSLATSRYEATATLLPNGKVLVAGGIHGTGALAYSLATAELYDPAAGTWSATGSMNAARAAQTATLLPNGKVLVAGGCSGRRCGTSVATAEIYDPATGTWAVTGSMTTARTAHVAALLPNGRVLVAGGRGAGTSAEVYNPASGTWSATGSMGTARAYATATLLGGGSVLVAGGQSGISSAELYNPGTGTWSATGSMATGRFEHTATLLPDGRVLVAGGASSAGPAIATAEIYTP